jgi:O-antigen/teichoic acid export membrane protein
MKPPNNITRESADSVPQIHSQDDANLLTRVKGILRSNQDLLRNAGSLLATTGVTSLFGFAFWIFAARVFSQESVGYGSAAVSAMSLLGTIGMFGLGTMLIGELPQRRSKGGLVAAALGASAAGSLVLGAGFALVSLAFGKHFVEIDGTLARIAVFSFGVALTGASLVFDEATIGLLRGGIQLTRNTVFSVAKMAVLPVTALAIHSEFGVGILFSWIIGTLISLVPAVVMIRRGGSSVLHRPDWGSLRRLSRVTMAHNWLNLTITAPPQLIPVLVTVIVSPKANAAFYIASMIVGILSMVPGHLSTVLFAIVSATPEAIAEKLRFVLRLSFGVGLAAMLVLGAGAHLILGIFGAQYANEATVPMLLLLFRYIPSVPKTQYIAVCRATGQVSRATAVMGVQSAAELISVIVGGKLDSLTGVCLGLLVVGIIEGLMTTPAVFRAAMGRLRVPVTATAPAAVYDETVIDMPAVPATADLDYQHRQNAGLAALISIATSVTPDRHAYDVITDSFPAISIPALRDSAASAAAASARGEAAPPRGRGRHRRTGPIPVSDATTFDIPAMSAEQGARADDPAYQIRQQAGLAALMALTVRPVQFLRVPPASYKVTPTCVSRLARTARLPFRYSRGPASIPPISRRISPDGSVGLSFTRPLSVKIRARPLAILGGNSTLDRGFFITIAVSAAVQPEPYALICRVSSARPVRWKCQTIAAGSYTSRCPPRITRMNMSRSSPPPDGVPAPRASSNPPRSLRAVRDIAKLAPAPKIPGEYGYSGDSSRFARKSKIRRSQTVPQPSRR